MKCEAKWCFTPDHVFFTTGVHSVGSVCWQKCVAAARSRFGGVTMQTLVVGWLHGSILSPMPARLPDMSYWGTGLPAQPQRRVQLSYGRLVS